jgi:hypothetical protein
MKKLIGLLVVLFLLSGCAYQRYASRQFKPKDKAKCRVYDEAHTMRDYYRLK